MWIPAFAGMTTRSREIPRPQVGGLTIFEVQNREFLVVLAGSGIIRFCGVKLVVSI